MKKRTVSFWLMMIMLVVALCGCSEKLGKTKNERVIDYTVVKAEDVPEAFKNQIEQAKSEVMKLSYADEKYLYIAKGYGTKETGGYSITVTQLYVQDKAIYFDTKLIEPAEGEKVSNQPSYPYIIVKTELSDMPVVFQ